MPQTSTANLADFEPNTSPATASLDEFQPEVLPATGPVTLTTKRGGSSGVLPPEPTKPSWRDYAGSAVAAVTGMEPGAETGLSDFKSQEASQRLTEAGTPGKRLTGVLGLADLALEPTTAVMGPAGAESIGATRAAVEAAPTLGKAAWQVVKNPLVRGFGEGAAASYGAGKVAEKAGADEEQKSLIESLAFWAPGVAHSISASLGLAEPKLGVQTGPEGTGVGISGAGG